MIGLSIIGNIRGSQLEMIKRISEEHYDILAKEKHTFGMAPIGIATFFFPLS
jgi:hypothetical protein